MSFANRYRVKPGEPVRLDAIDPSEKGPPKSHKAAQPQMEDCLARLEAQQYLLFANGGPSLLVVLQGLDAAGKDGTIRHVFTGMNPQGTRVASFKVPTPEEAAHDFLWRAHRAAPRRGEVVIFNRSHYEDVLVVRVHDLVPPEVWRERYALINAFEAMLAANGTRILKFYLHIGPDEQLDRFRKRLSDKARQWKISEADYTERKLWDRYREAYEEALERTSTANAPWFVIPADHKWWRNLAVAEIMAEAMEDLGLKPPAPSVDLADIKRRFHAASRAGGEGG